MTGVINSIETMGLLDGPGIRIVIFMQGCCLRCKFCHNPETWSVLGGITMSPQEVIEKILKYKNYFGMDGGVTFSGGEPLMQEQFLLETLKLCKKNHIHTALDTSGVGDHYNEILEYTDLVIWDVKAYESTLYQKITGQSITRSLSFLDTCQKMNKKMWIRQVIIPGINDTKEYILGLQEFLKPLKNIEKVELLPYETLGISKYENLKIPYRLKGVSPMDIQRCQKLNDILQEGVYR